MPDEDSRFSKKVYQPIPINLQINMTILTRYQQDYDQIITNFVPYFDPYIVISWRTPGQSTQEIRSQVEWSGSVNTLYPTDLNATQVARVQGETSFIFKGWLFKAPAATKDAKIFNITADFSTLANLSTQYSLDNIDPAATDRVSLSGQPQPRTLF
jgi:hypothetical protein